MVQTNVRQIRGFYWKRTKNVPRAICNDAEHARRQHREPSQFELP